MSFTFKRRDSKKLEQESKDRVICPKCNKYYKESTDLDIYCICEK
jgi:ribosomal protein L37AE/L43A